jgi:hypothetical protein
MENNTELFESIFNRNLHDTDTQSYLENIATEHPYFSPAQFYLLLQTNKHDPDYKKQVQKTAALFNNNYWLNYLLVTSSTQEQIFIPASSEQTETIADVKESFLAENNNEEKVEKVIVQDETARSTDIAVNNAISASEDEANEFPADDEEINNTENIFATEDAQPNLIEERRPLDEIRLTNNEPAANDEMVNSGQSHETPLPTNNAAVSENIREEKLNDPDTISPAENKIPVTDNVNSPDTMLFTPLHTSDYFASVGIKLSDEVNASDRLGKQLKSFTQWLKTMKKIDSRNESSLPEETGTDNYSNTIQSLAEKSNKEDEVITEAMADVLVQQGRIAKAVEVLKKLSLLNPSKSTYFAAKIDQLKD